MTKLLEPKVWIGEFFSSNYEKRFPGKVIYSPENGIVLDYTITGLEQPAATEYVYGVLENGRKCTLVGWFDPAHSGMSIHHGFSTLSGKNGFHFLVIGEFLNDNSMFKKLTFTITSLHEFFSPRGFKDSVRHTGRPLIEAALSYGRLSIGTTASFISLSKDIAAHIYSHNESAINELQECFKAVEERHPKSFFMLKKDIDYNVRLEMNSEADVRSLYKHILELTALFSILLYNPVLPESIEIHSGEDENRLSLEVYPSQVIDKRTLEFATQQSSHFHMPITNSNIDLAKTIEQWSTMADDFSVIVSSIQTETGFRSRHSILSDLVLYATQLESISYSASIQNQDRYEWPIDTYGSIQLKDVLSKLFSKANAKSVGQNIGDLRNEIAHIKKSRKLLIVLSQVDLIIISQCLQLVIIGYILRQLGIQETTAKEYLDAFTRFRI